jgi:hypothetical protein
VIVCRVYVALNIEARYEAYEENVSFCHELKETHKNSSTSDARMAVALDVMKNLGLAPKRDSYSEISLSSIGQSERGCSTARATTRLDKAL